MAGGGAPDYPRDPVARRRFQETSAAVLRALLDGDPRRRTLLATSGTAAAAADAAAAARSLTAPLPDTSPPGLLERERVLVDALEVLDGIDDAGLEVDDAVDLEVLRSDVARRLWQVSELRPASWDARVHVPGDALRAVLAAPAPAADRAAALLDRLEELPAALEASRDSLELPSSPHGLAALDELTALRGELAGPAVRDLLGPAHGGRAERVPAAADEALRAHAGWLGGLLALARRTGAADPRLGSQRYAAQLWYCLDAEVDPETLLTRAECDLMEGEEALAAEASRYLGAPPRAGQPAEALAAVARAHAVPAADAARTAAEEWVALLEQVRGAGWVQLPPPVAAVDPARLLAPLPGGPPGNRARLVLELARRGVPGRLLVDAHAGGAAGSATRTALASACAAAGWEECAADLVAGAGAAAGAEGSLPAAVRLLRRADAVRAAAGAVVDVRVHCEGAQADDVRDLLVARAHLSEEEAVGRWRASLLDSAVLPVVHVGHGQVAEVLRDLAAARPAWTPSRRHEAVLRTGAPPPRHLHALLDLPDRAPG